MGLLWLIATIVFGQEARVREAPVEFEVASVKKHVDLPPGTVISRRGGPGTDDTGQISWPAVSVRALLRHAYGVDDYQVVGPAWLRTELFDIVVKLPPGTTRAQSMLMWQKLLGDRFHVELHRETREVPVYELMVASSGPKLKESDLIHSSVAKSRYGPTDA